MQAEELEALKHIALQTSVMYLLHYVMMLKIGFIMMDVMFKRLIFL